MRYALAIAVIAWTATAVVGAQARVPAAPGILHVGGTLGTLVWDASTTPTVTGYKVVYGPHSGFYVASVDVGPSLSWPIAGIDPTVDTFFAVQAYTASADSLYSNEVELPASQPGQPVNNAQIFASRGYPLVVGTPVTWSASAIDPSPLEYEFWLCQNGQWSLARAWATTSTFTWTPPNTLGCGVEFWVRRVGSTALLQGWDYDVFTVNGS